MIPVPQAGKIIVFLAYWWSFHLQRTAGGRLGVKVPFVTELRQTCASTWRIEKQVLRLRGKDPTAAALTCCKEMDYLELRVCTEMCLSQLQSGTKTLEQCMESTSLLLHNKTCCEHSHWVFFLLIPVKRNLDLSCPCATWLTHQPPSQMGYSEIAPSQGICQNLHLHSLWSVPNN